VTGPPVGAAQVTCTESTPVTNTDGLPGAPGRARLTAADLATDGVLPAGPFAVTRNVYDVPAVNPVNEQVSTMTSAQPTGGVTGGSDVTV
jgi:hypothetical protein